MFCFFLGGIFKLILQVSFEWKQGSHKDDAAWLKSLQLAETTQERVIWPNEILPKKAVMFEKKVPLRHLGSTIGEWTLEKHTDRDWMGMEYVVPAGALLESLMLHFLI